MSKSIEPDLPYRPSRENTLGMRHHLRHHRKQQLKYQLCGRQRHGVALLIVLAALIVTVPILVGVVQVVATARAQQEMHRAAVIADDLLAAAEEPIQDWLSSSSATISLPVDAATPAVLILHDQLEMLGGGKATSELRITAWDQYGMVPLSLIKRGSPLRLTLPAQIAMMADSIDDTTSAKPNGEKTIGLDQIFASTFVLHDESSSQAMRRPTTADRPVFPPGGRRSDQGEEQEGALIYSDNGILGVSGTPPVVATDGNQRAMKNTLDHAASRLGERLSRSSAAFGALVATHNHDNDDDGSGNSSPRINVHTAPMPLVEAALIAAGRGGLLPRIISARAEGRIATLAFSSPSSARSMPTILRPILVSSSDCWAVRIDIRVGKLRRSWWAVYRRGRSSTTLRSNNNSNDYQWECVQRLVIPFG